jgi:hypothetical protein
MDTHDLRDLFLGASPVEQEQELFVLGALDTSDDVDKSGVSVAPDVLGDTGPQVRRGDGGLKET